MRGKAAAQSANRRTNEALERVAALESQLRTEREAATKEANELKGQIRKLQARGAQEVEELAAERVADVTRRAEERRIAELEAAEDRAVDALGKLINNSVKLAIPLTVAIEFAETLKVQHLFAINGAGAGREYRRAGLYKKRAAAATNVAYRGGFKQEPTLGMPVDNDQWAPDARYPTLDQDAP